MLDAHAVLQLVGRLASRSDRASLAELAQEAGWSPFHLHRAFRRVIGETPLQYQRRLRLEAAALALRHTALPVAEIGRDAGFQSHPGFTRAFVARFGHSPFEHRAQANTSTDPEEAELVAWLGPCVGLFHLAPPRMVPMSMSIESQTRALQPILFMRRRVAPSQVAAALAECLPAVFLHCQQHGVAMAGPPFARYPDRGRGLMTVECGMPVMAAAPAADDILAGTLHEGDVAVGIHQGPYENLGDAHALVEQWIEAAGHSVAGAPWEVYLTDPAEHPDPADWKTEICWPHVTAS